jgi:tetratricopeptide (TPR) repeat protein
MYDEEVIELNNKALELFREDKIDSALILINKAIEIDSAYHLAYYNKCNFLWQLGRNDEALLTAKQFVKNSNEQAFITLGLAYEKVGKPNKAKECYKILLDSATIYYSDTLDFRTSLGFATLTTITQGKEKGYSEIQKVFNKFQSNLTEFELKELKMYRNEIESYQNGGYLEFMEGEEKQYCITTEKNIESINEYLLDNGINAQFFGNENGFYLRIKNKFRDKALSLEITECK